MEAATNGGHGESAAGRPIRALLAAAAGYVLLALLAVVAVVFVGFAAGAIVTGLEFGWHLAR